MSQIVVRDPAMDASQARDDQRGERHPLPRIRTMASGLFRQAESGRFPMTS
jgi:hypothetical protein